MKVSRGWLDITKNIITIFILIGIFIYLIINWSNFPDKIPGHYNAAGVVDRWGSKGELLILPFISLILYLIITVTEKFPQIWNTGVAITQDNKERVYGALTSMIVTEKLIMVAVFAYITLYQTTAKPLSGWFLLLFLISALGSIAFYIVKLNKVSKTHSAS